MKPAPDQLNVIKKLINSGSQTSLKLGIPLEDVEIFLSKVEDFVRKHYGNIGQRPYVLLLDKSGRKNSLLAHSDVIKSINSGKAIIRTDIDLGFITSDVGQATITQCESMTGAASTLAILISGSYVYDILCGRTVNERDILRAEVVTPVISKFHRSASEFDSLLDDHYDHCVAGEKEVRYWNDKEKRILLTGPDGTESIFQHSLFWWLDNFVMDKIKVYAEPRRFGQDATDVVVVTITGAYVVEVKWLGKNDQGTTYGQNRINEGLAQVKIYLDNDRDFICGYLVAYDGRSYDDHQKLSYYAESLRHELCDSPKILFLRSESPSKVAIKEAKKLRT